MSHYDDGISRYDDGITRFDEPEPAGNKTRMAKVALKLSRKNLEDKLKLGTDLVTACTGNADLTTPVPTLASITGQIVATRLKISNRKVHLDAATAITLLINTDEDNLDISLNQLAGCAEVATTYNAAKLTGLGFPLAAEGASIGDLLPPEHFTITLGDHAGKIDGHCDRERGASNYIVEYSTSATVPFVVGYSGPRSQFSIEGLISGTLYYFRMKATGTNGDSEYTGITEKRAP